MKYRIWDISNNCYDIKNRLSYLFVKPNGEVCWRNESNRVEEIDYQNYIIEKYTEIEDINGDEIYVGDIVVDDENMSGVISQESSGCFIIKVGVVAYDAENIVEPKIVGNIHDMEE